MSLITKLFGTFSDKELKRIQPITQKVLDLKPHYEVLSDEELQAVTPALKQRLADGETLDDILPDAFAACREASRRVLGMEHFPVQITGGIVLHRACIAEMQTGEGKTLVATLPVYLNALAGKGVHVVTVNDYLARRDSEWMGKLYRFMGLTVGLVVHGVTAEGRKAAYRADITYGTNNEFGFDYLRDNMVVQKEQMVQRGHAYAIVDEVDSILIDEARTPLIISGSGGDSSALYQKADQFASRLKKSVVTELDDKEDQDAQVDGDYVVDEKRRTATLTQEGIKKAEAFFGVENITDADNMTLLHHINQAIKARGVMKRDIDYVVRDGEVIIVDEFTGRLMIGRRYNEGLHQAIEAKEGVKVAAESKTLATVTFQNYFRMYEKLAGMTGTASTEADEFSEIYGLNIVTVPTNRPRQRQDMHDVVYKTVKGKYNAVIEQVVECHAKGQPVLVGTVSIEKSELLSRLLKAKGVPHNVLNAKNHEREAEIVAQAGKKGAVTIATNMAGRGTDIMLGGNAEYMAKDEMRRMQYSEELISEATAFGDTDNEEILEARRTFSELNAKYKELIRPEADEVRACGGLYIIGTERHESRRIDNQLRGRSGRQGDPGASRFYISLEDDLMRLFGGERIGAMMDRLNVSDDTPIEAKMLTKTIENAQLKVEDRNFSIRKNVLQYDDVLSRQREVIYTQRNAVLDGADLKEAILRMIDSALQTKVDRYLPKNTEHDNWDLEGLREQYLGWLISDDDLVFTKDELEDLDPEFVTSELQKKAHDLYEVREQEFTPAITRELERVILLKNVDRYWMDHIDAMDELKKGINLRAYAQRDPVVEYRVEGSDMFDATIDQIREDTARMMLTVKLRTKEEPQREQVAKPTGTGGGGDGSDKKRPVRITKKIGRNDPCPCGSGKKYKKCCGRNEE